MKVTRINGHNFNADWAQCVDEQTFVDMLLPAPFWKEEPEKGAKLRKSWRLMNGLPEEEIAAADEAPVPKTKPIPRKREAKKGGGK